VIRGHWGIENKNHYKRDTCQWREDGHRHRRVKAAQNLALTRNALLAIIPFDEKNTLSSVLDDFGNDRAEALKLILNASPI
jgi:predicted transposase YbfD/YdcC